METFWKIAGFSMLIIVVILALDYTDNTIMSPDVAGTVMQEEQQEVEETPSTPAPASSDSIDDLLMVFTQESEEERKVTAEVDSDTSLVTSDAEVISNFNTTYNENEL